MLKTITMCVVALSTLQACSKLKTAADVVGPQLGGLAVPASYLAEAQDGVRRSHVENADKCKHLQIGREPTAELTASFLTMTPENVVSFQWGKLNNKWDILLKEVKTGKKILLSVYAHADKCDHFERYEIAVEDEPTSHH